MAYEAGYGGLLRLEDGRLYCCLPLTRLFATNDSGWRMVIHAQCFAGFAAAIAGKPLAGQSVGAVERGHSRHGGGRQFPVFVDTVCRAARTAARLVARIHPF